MLDKYEALAVVGTTFGIGGFVLSAIAVIVIMRLRYFGGHPHGHHHHSGLYDAGMDMDDDNFNGAAVPIAGKHDTHTHVSVITGSGRPLNWRPFWPLFFCIAFITLVLIGLPILIWFSGDDHHHFHHHGDDSSSAAASSEASSSSSASVI